MNKNFKKIIEDAKTFSLSENDKKSVMDKVSMFIKENPIVGVSDGILTPYMKDEMSGPYGRQNIWDSVRSSFPILSTFKKNKFFLR